jgi:ABC-type glycerol-3-phosphate transport system substrate-binding protein
MSDNPTNPAHSSRVRHCARFRRPLVAAAALGAAVLVLAACGKADSPTTAASSAPTSSFTAAAQNSSTPLTVWVDSTRLPGVQAYQKAHPDVKLNIVTYNGDANGSNYLQTKVELYDRSGSGWPDVVFTENVNDITWATESGISFAAPLNKGYVPAATLAGFATNALSPCTFGGNVYCLRNDLAQNVLWYNKKLLTSFGYQVPTTWQQYKALGEKVAKQHPGYIIGTVGDAWAPEVYFWASQCRANQVTPPSTLTVDTASADCTRMASLLDTLVKNKSVSTDTVFSAGFLKDTASKTLMLVGPSWYGQTLFNSVFKTPAGEIAAAPPLSWAGQNGTYTGDVGGGAWIVSAHSKNLNAASALATWMATANAYQAIAGTYPAYKPAATAWLANQAKTGYFADDVAPAFTAAAGMVWTGWSATKFSQEAIWAATVVPALTQGKTITSLLPTWQTAIKNQAQTLGYTVKG